MGNQEGQNRTLAAFCRSLAIETRVSILMHILKTPGCIVDDIVEVNGVSKTTIAAHLRRLKKEGLIKGTISQNHYKYCIDHDKLKAFKSSMDTLFDAAAMHAHTQETNDLNCH
jgi:predicted transcriptional regulator